MEFLEGFGIPMMGRCRSLLSPIVAVDDYGGTLGALALNRSGFCNVGVKANRHR